MHDERAAAEATAGRRAGGKTRLLLPLSGLWMAGLARGALDPSHYEIRVATLHSPDVDWCDVVLPLSVPNQLTLAALFPEEAGRKFLCPSIEVTRLCADKALFATFMRDNGFAAHVPRPAGPGSERVIEKPRIAEGGMEVTLSPARDAGAGQGRGADGGLIRQEWIEAEREYTANILFDGRIRFSLGVEYEKPATSHIKRKPKDTPMAFQPVPAPFLALFERLLAALGYRGICCIDYVLVDGQPVILEVNPRICGSILGADVNGLADAYCAALAPRG